MDSRHHDRITELFAAALDMPEDDRRTYLQNQCAGDDALMHEVLDLLRRDEAPSAIDEPIIEQSVSQKLFADAEFDAPHTPREIGPYEIIDVLGRGGMGTVYRARQKHPSRSVALKVVHSPLFSRTLARRIEYEAQVLARLQHVGIAQIFEAGTANAAGVTVPFFALELVDGLPLTEHARTFHLSTVDKLKLIVKVCSAIQHAHQQGVIHRDLKPANVLVTRQGQPKVLDFGIARVTDSDIRSTTLHTDAGQLVGTVAYMSPEQVIGDSSAIDTRSDVYALGVLTFELLTGTLPHPVSGKTIAEAARIIRDDNPRSLHGMGVDYHDDLETVVQKALEKDRERRYASAAEFAADLNRYLANEPVLARPASLTYQLRKFAQRNRGLVTSVVAAVVLLIVAIAGTSYGMYHATRERDAAIEARMELQKAKEAIEAETAKLVAVNTFFGQMLMSPDPMGEGAGKREITIVEALDRQVDSIRDAFKEQPAIESAIRTTIGSTYAGLGRLEDAEKQLRIALEKHRETSGDDHSDSLRAERDLASVLVQQGQLDEAIPLMRSSLTRLTQQPDFKKDSEYAIAAARLGWALGQQKEYAESETWIRPAIPILEAGNEAHAHFLASARNNLAKAVHHLGRLAEAEELYTSAHDAFVEIYGPEHTTVALTMNNIARMRQSQGDLEGAVEGYLGALNILRKALGPNHPTLATIINNVGLIYYDLGKYEESAILLHEALTIYQQAFGEDHPETVSGYYSHALALLALKKYEEAAASYKHVADWRRESLGPDADKTLLAELHWAESVAPLGKTQEAESVMRRVLKKFKETLSMDDPRTQVALRALFRLLLANEQLDECRTLRTQLSPKVQDSAALLKETEGQF
jgi:non-specific serine/threonine protein kinase/serine/threonine-protein kinase